MIKKRACILGAGIGGLACGARLSHMGFNTDIYERNQTVGGKANQIIQNGFRFDTGPSLITMPFVLQRLFEDVGEQISDYIDLRKLDILCKYFFSEGSVLTAYSDTARFAEEIENKTADTKYDVIDYLNYCKKIYDLSGELFLLKSLSEASTFLNTKALKALLKIKRMDTLRTIHSANASYFKDDRTIMIFDRYATYSGSTPFKAPATLNVIQHVEYSLGGYASIGGVYEISRSLSKIAEKKGAKIYTGTHIDEIIHEGGRIKGVKINGKIIEYDVIVSNADVHYTYRSLLNDEKSRMARRYSRLEKSSSAYVFYWGIGRRFMQLETHNIIFAKNYKREFIDLFERKIISDDPTVYIYISSKLNNTDAPAGCENWFVLINAPSVEDESSQDISTGDVRKIVIDKISSVLRMDIEKHIITEEVLTPNLIEKKYNSVGGSIYGISSNNRIAAFLRQQNRSKDYEGLYFCGGSAHPGGGIPLVVLSAEITSGLINKYELRND
jgi:phytoene desaturase